MVNALFIYRLRSVIVACLAVVMLSSCGSDKVYEGTIEFEVSYPYFRASGFMAGMLPDKMVMRFKGNKYKTEVKKGRAFSSSFIIDCDNKTLTTMFQFGQRRKYAILEEAAVLKRRDEKFPIPTYMHTNEGDSIVGFLCRKSVAIFEELGQPEATLYYTDEIGIKNPNWCFPYHAIDGVMLIYELQQFGIRMRFTAEKFDPAPIDDKIFEVPSNYNAVPFAELEKEMEEMFSTIVD
ncbi:MAG: hypothetical protein ACK40M_09935 [Flavobacteriales bacterium]